MAQRRGPKSLSSEHKAALAEGRNQSRAVRRYLEALEAHKPKRGRQRTPETIKKQLAAVEEDIDSADPLKRVQLLQKRLDLTKELEAKTVSVDISSFEKDFVALAKAYSQSKGISYTAWREAGVPAAVLKSAGISRAG
ncbi:MAG: hypothetical protein OEW42_00425 [Acidimicrobiia bacterium]|nr:hypothetical protein [Acidimicrobiia bacterium]